ncbi:hypothetical protein [Ureibacillus thermosphaericus]|uniref:Uncharacterized protein n=1 Tax=Ureibacillus thermosphaericus TaxID=51173 RepID=A0A840Q1D3_URETH|nr:hypothetical protein [Ureibacillus thermosphaericus]MBB5150278.1 hypothetical protein [Ureibacillus thermosphaericus]NKZ32889.1 hypothetical protein [Ureibacillus thermosphaericus]
MFSFTAINKAEAIINNPNKTTLTDDEKGLLAEHRTHLIERINFYRGILKQNYDKVIECEGLNAE